MAIYFFEMVTPLGRAPDIEGVYLPDIESVRRETIRSLKEIAVNYLKAGYTLDQALAGHMEVLDELGRIVLSMSMAAAVQMEGHRS